MSLERLKGIKDWVLSQLLSPSLTLSRQASGSCTFFREEPMDEEFNCQDREHGFAGSTSLSSSCLDGQPNSSFQQDPIGDSYKPRHCRESQKLHPLDKIVDLRINFLRVLQRLGQSEGNLVVAKVLYRLHLATLIRSSESELGRLDPRNDRAREIATGQEAAGSSELDFSMRILVLGKSGIGKSATINSLFDLAKTKTDAFNPATDCIQEVAGTVHGIRVTVIDTPGLFPNSMSSLRRNRKILSSIKRFIRKAPPDIVLYFERLDVINTSYIDLPLLKLVADVFGSAIWFNTIIVMTHSSSDLPEGTDGYPVSYDNHVSRCTAVVRHSIQQSVSDSKLENLVLFVENLPQFKTNFKGDKILLHEQDWKPQLLLVCACTKVLCDVNTLLKFENGFGLGPVGTARLPSLPHLFWSFLERRHLERPTRAGHEFKEVSSSSEMDENEDYDKLPPIRILTKSQFQKLTSSQKKDYLDELDYRETLYLKKQLKEKSLRQQEADEMFDQQGSSPEAVLLPDMAVPPSFDSNCPVHRYRCLVAADQWLVRPVLDPHGWDHDVGFDGVNLEGTIELQRNVLATASGQMSKDKRDFTIQSDCTVAYTPSRGPNYCLGLDVQSAGKDLIYTIHSTAKHINLFRNTAECGFSATSFGDKHYYGIKLEDAISVGRSLRFLINGGRMIHGEKIVNGGSVNVTLRGRDYPVRNDNLSLTLTALSLSKETVIGAGFQSDFRPGRGTGVSVNANLNSRKMGQLCVKISSSEHAEIALIALFSIFRALFRTKALESGG